MSASTAGFEIRPASEQDLEAILALEGSMPTAPHWPVGTYQRIMQASAADSPAGYPKRCLLVAINDGSRLVGFAAGTFKSTGEAELETVAVAEAERRQGIGAELCLKVATWARGLGAPELLLEVRASSHGVIGLYRKLGFEAIGRRRGYYRQPQDDALVMRLALG
jgi:[ribosomal protein S18]-alanine N-acetyltransferase